MHIVSSHICILRIYQNILSCYDSFNRKSPLMISVTNFQQVKLQTFICLLVNLGIKKQKFYEISQVLEISRGNELLSYAVKEVVGFVFVVFWDFLFVYRPCFLGNSDPQSTMDLV